MKNFKFRTLKGLFLAVLMTFFATSCSEEAGEEVTSDLELNIVQEENVDQIQQNQDFDFVSLGKELSKMRQVGIENRRKGEKIDYVNFNVAIVENRFEVSNVSYISSDVYELSLGLGNKQNIMTRDGDITVTCSGGSEDGEVTICPDKFGQKVCVGKAIAACLDGDGCSEVCRSSVTMRL